MERNGYVFLHITHTTVIYYFFSSQGLSLSSLASTCNFFSDLHDMLYSVVQKDVLVYDEVTFTIGKKNYILCRADCRYVSFLWCKFFPIHHDFVS